MWVVNLSRGAQCSVTSHTGTGTHHLNGAGHLPVLDGGAAAVLEGVHPPSTPCQEPRLGLKIRSVCMY
jgi:hypothetical protein